MPARGVCLVTLSLSKAGPRRFGRQVSVTDIYHTMPYHTMCCTWPYAVPVGEDPAAHGHWCTFTDPYHAIPCHVHCCVRIAMPYHATFKFSSASPPGRHQEQAPKQRCTFRPTSVFCQFSSASGRSNMLYFWHHFVQFSSVQLTTRCFAWHAPLCSWSDRLSSF